jgi:hypothetical protein
MKESVIKVEVFATVKMRKHAETIPKSRKTLFQGEENDVAIVGGDLKANCNNNVTEKNERLDWYICKADDSFDLRERENDEPINHQVHSTTYVEDYGNILVAKSKKKIFVRANLYNNENKIEDCSDWIDTFED